MIWRLDQALGISREPRIPLSEPSCHKVRRDYPELLISSEALLNEVNRLAAALARDLEASHQGARRARLSLYRADGTWAQVLIGTSSPCRDADHFMQLIREKIECVDAGFGIDVLIFEAVEVEQLDETQTRFGPRSARDFEILAGAPVHQLVDQLVNRLGQANVFALGQRASHRPELAQIEVAPLQATSMQTPSIQATSASWRPPFLLPAPEAVTVVAVTAQGAPTHFIWRRITRHVATAQGPERIAPEWWHVLQHRSDEGSVKQRTRDYYRLEDNHGGGYWVFRARIQPRIQQGEGLCQANPPEFNMETPSAWFMHGLFG